MDTGLVIIVIISYLVGSNSYTLLNCRVHWIFGTFFVFCGPFVWFRWLYMVAGGIQADWLGGCDLQW